MIELIGCEGVVAGLEERINQLGEEEFYQWARFNYRMGRASECWRQSDHLLVVAKKIGKG